MKGRRTGGIGRGYWPDIQGEYVADQNEGAGQGGTGQASAGRLCRIGGSDCGAESQIDALAEKGAILSRITQARRSSRSRPAGKV